MSTNKIRSFADEHEGYDCAKPDSQAIHCFYCDHECAIDAAFCCACGAHFPPRRAIWPLRERINTTKANEPLQPPLSFNSFRKLPPELRNKIWALSLPGPRVVSLEAHPTNWVLCGTHQGQVTWVDNQQTAATWKCNHNFFSCYPRYLVFFKPSSPNPAVLFVCRESRAIASGSLSLTFGRPPRTWFNFKSDTLYLDFGVPDRRHYSVREDLRDVSKVENLALFNIFGSGILHRESTWGLNQYLEDILPFFCNLKRLSLVVKRLISAGSGDLVLDHKIHDFDQSIAFFSQPFDPLRSSKYYYQRCDSHPLQGHMARWAALTRNRQSEDLNFIPAEFSTGVITTAAKKAQLDGAIRSWTLQRMAHITPQEYKILITLSRFSDIYRLSRNSIHQSGPIELRVHPQTSGFIIESKIRELWNLPDTMKVTMSCNNDFNFRREDLVGHMELFQPSFMEGALIALPDGLRRPINRLHIMVVERSTKVWSGVSSLNYSDTILYTSFPSSNGSDHG